LLAGFEYFETLSYSILLMLFHDFYGLHHATLSANPR
jgi:hypothetical protein